MSFPSSPVALLQELIRVPSVNPDSAAVDEETAGEKKCAELVGEFLNELGAKVTFETVLPDRPNVIGRLPGDDGGKSAILFAPHLDTVSARGMTIDPFAATVSEGKIWGRGASDTKGTMAAMLWALHEMRDQISSLPVAVAFVGLMGEETGQPGSKHFAKNHRGEFEFAVIGEPTSLQIVHAHKGFGWHLLKTEGISCHGSTPEKGVNAIRKMLPAVQALLTYLQEQFPKYTDPYLGQPTVNLGTMHGGSSRNVVPSSCEVTLDIRETPALYAAGGSGKLIRDFLAQSEWADQVAVETEATGKPLLTPPETDGVRRLQSIGAALTTAPWYCDAGRLAEGNIPAVAVGPGSIAQAHTKDEFLSVQDLEAGCHFYRRFLESYRDLVIC